MIRDDRAMTKHANIIALNAQELPADLSSAPDWVHLLPTSKGLVHTGDNRGPYHVTDAQAIIDASFAALAKLPIDENHAIDLAAPKGQPAPARGWIVEMQARGDGIWGRVEWTDEGRELVASKAYFGISPVISRPTTSKKITGIQRASLVNRPNLRGLTALHQENTDMFQETVAGWLGLNADASEADIETAIKAQGKTSELQSQMGEIATLFGVEDGGDVLAAAKAAKTGTAGGGAVVTELQSAVTTLQGTVTDLQSENQTLRDDRKRDQAEAFVDGEIKKGRIGLKPQRDTYIEMHQENPDRTVKLVSAMPVMPGTVIADLPPETGDTVTELNAQELSDKAVALIGARADKGQVLSITEAVNLIKEGKE